VTGEHAREVSKNALLLTATCIFPLALIGAAACTEAKNGDGASPDADAATTNDAASQSQADAGAGEGGPGTGPIAPECTKELAWCAQGHAAASLACKDVDGKPYTITTTFSGKTDNVACAVSESGDLELRLGPPQADTAAYDTHWVRFRLRSYTGGGTYELTRSADEDIDHGFQLQGAAGGSQADEGALTAGTWACGPSPCKAVVAPESEPIPNGDDVQEFRVRVEVRCDPSGKLWWHPDCNATDCSFTSAPTFNFDVQCSH
jgi:hypothetical protein